MNFNNNFTLLDIDRQKEQADYHPIVKMVLYILIIWNLIWVFSPILSNHIINIQIIDSDNIRQEIIYSIYSMTLVIAYVLLLKKNKFALELYWLHIIYYYINFIDNQIGGDNVLTNYTIWSFVALLIALLRALIFYAPLLLVLLIKYKGVRALHILRPDYNTKANTIDEKELFKYAALRWKQHKK